MMIEIIGYYFILLLVVTSIYWIVTKRNPFVEAYYYAITFTVLFIGTLLGFFFIIASFGPKPPDDGWNRTYFDNGQIQTEFFAEDGKIEGRHTYYYKDGKIRFLSNYKNGILTDSSFSYFKDGTISSLEIYQNGETIYEEDYFESGQLKKYIKRSTQNYPRTTKVEYYPNGNKRFVTNISDANYRGQGIYYYSNGTIKFRGEYRDGKKDGIWEFRDSLDGIVIDKDTFDFLKDREFKSAWN